MRLLFDSVTLVGYKQPNGNARGMQTRIALVPNLEHHLDTTERLFTEYDIITEFLKRHLRQSFLPDDYTPHAEFMKFRRGAHRSDIKDVLAKLKEALAEKPLLITLKDLELPEPDPPRKRKKKAKQENQK
jgi:hypothetical protein